MSVRFAKENELEKINELREQVNDLHTQNRPDIFKQGFSEELRNYIYEIFKNPQQKIIVNECSGQIAGYAVLNHIKKPESVFMNPRDFLDIDEFCVDEKWRRKGIASEMIAFIKDYAHQIGVNRLELNMWEFNKSALSFYEAVGFETFRRYMEMEI